MNRDKLIKLSAATAICAIVLLIYWTFTFIAITVFDFKVFRENMTETFFMSVLGLLAVLVGALIINVIFNLSKIGEALAQRHPTAEHVLPVKGGKRTAWAMLALFPLIFAGLYFGNEATSSKKRARLLEAAAKVVETNRADIEAMGNYRFDAEYIESASAVLARITKEESYFPAATIILPDRIDGHATLLEFRSWFYREENKVPNKVEFIRNCTPEERAYLGSVFAGTNVNHRFSAHKGTYELFYPIKTAKGTIVLFLSEYSDYGKIGS